MPKTIRSADFHDYVIPVIVAKLVATIGAEFHAIQPRTPMMVDLNALTSAPNGFTAISSGNHSYTSISDHLPNAAVAFAVPPITTTG